MTCAHCSDAQQLFNHRRARRELKKYRRKGAQGSTRLLIDALRDLDVPSGSLLDVGGGVGAIQHELLSTGLERVTSVDASKAYLEASRSEAERQGYADRAAYHVGDFIDLEPELGEADIVTLDRVVCCYPDMPRLVGASAAKARRLYGLVFPRRRWPVRIVMRCMNILEALKRNTFRVFIHPPEAIDAAVRAQGFELARTADTFLWRVAVYARAP